MKKYLLLFNLFLCFSSYAVDPDYLPGECGNERLYVDPNHNLLLSGVIDFYQICGLKGLTYSYLETKVLVNNRFYVVWVANNCVKIKV